MKIQVIGLGQFGEFLASLYVEAGEEVWGWDTNPIKKGLVESHGGIWGQCPMPEATLLCCFPKQYSKEMILTTGMVVNLSSVQSPGIEKLRELGVANERISSFHPLFGPIGVNKSGWVGKKIITTTPIVFPSLFSPFLEKGVSLEAMTPEEHDEKMLPHAIAFFLGQLAKIGFAGMGDRYLTGSARHALDLLGFVSGSSELTDHILSNPALKKRWPVIRGRLTGLVKQFGWED